MPTQNGNIRTYTITTELTSIGANDLCPDEMKIQLRDLSLSVGVDGIVWDDSGDSVAVYTDGAPSGADQTALDSYMTDYVASAEDHKWHDDQVFATDTSPFSADLVWQATFDGNLNEAASSGGSRDLVYSASEKHYAMIRGKQFFSIAAGETLDRAGTLDAALDITGAVTYAILADLSGLADVDSVIMVFGDPGTNAAGTNYRWSLYYDGTSEQLQMIHETGSGTKHTSTFNVSLSGVHQFVCRRSADLGGGTQDNTLFVDGVEIETYQTSAVSNGTSVTQELVFGGSARILVGSAEVYDAALTDSDVMAMARQVRVAPDV